MCDALKVCPISCAKVRQVVYSLCDVDHELRATGAEQPWWGSSHLSVYTTDLIAYSETPGRGYRQMDDTAAVRARAAVAAFPFLSRISQLSQTLPESLRRVGLPTSLLHEDELSASPTFSVMPLPGIAGMQSVRMCQWEHPLHSGAWFTQRAKRSSSLPVSVATSTVISLPSLSRPSSSVYSPAILYSVPTGRVRDTRGARVARRRWDVYCTRGRCRSGRRGGWRPSAFLSPPTQEPRAFGSTTLGVEGLKFGPVSGRVSLGSMLMITYATHFTRRQQSRITLPPSSKRVAAVSRANSTPTWSSQISFVLAT